MQNYTLLNLILDPFKFWDTLILVYLTQFTPFNFGTLPNYAFLCFVYVKICGFKISSPLYFWSNANDRMIFVQIKSINQIKLI